MPGMRTVQTTSAGGVVVRKIGRGVEVVLCGRLEPPIWTLPKGAPRRRETMEQAAEREVSEETGLQVEILGKIGTIDYWFVRSGVRFHKMVHHFLMRPVGGDTSQHDHEYDVVQWFPVAEALQAMAYDNEKEVVHRAAEMAEEAAPRLVKENHAR